MKSRRRRTRRRERRNTLAWVLLAGAGIVLIVGMTLYFHGRSVYADLDEDLCPREQPEGGYVAVLLDVTDPFNATQRAWIRREFEGLKLGVPDQARLSIYTLGSEARDTIGPVLSRCNPGRGEELSRLWANPEMVRERWNNDFAAPLDSVLEATIRPTDRAETALMEKIQEIAVTAFPAGTPGMEPPKQLVLISDMLQHTQGNSHYGTRPPSFADFDGTVAFGRVRASMPQVDVVIYYARRDEPGAVGVQGRSHIEFWEQYFRALGAEVIHVTWIDG